MKSVSGDLCLVSVTYGDRADLIIKVVAAALDIGVSRAIVVDNGSTESSARKIADFAEQYAEVVSVVTMHANTGSAGGFKRGLEEAYGTGAEYIWILDDDNLPDDSALENLKAAHRLFGEDPNIVLCSYREDRKPYFNAVEYGVVPRIWPNSFLDFDFLDKLSRLCSFHRNSASGGAGAGFPVVRIYIAPYGGLYLNRRWIEIVGVPDDRLFLYGDDHEYTDRIVKAGGAIYLCARSRIRDIDQSWNEVAEVVPSWISKSADPKKIYYAIRNRVYLESGKVTNRWRYNTNLLCYMGILGCLSLLKNRSFSFTVNRLSLIFGAMRDGLRSSSAGRPVGDSLENVERADSCHARKN